MEKSFSSGPSARCIDPATLKSSVDQTKPDFSWNEMNSNYLIDYDLGYYKKSISFFKVIGPVESIPNCVQRIEKVFKDSDLIKKLIILKNIAEKLNPIYREPNNLTFGRLHFGPIFVDESCSVYLSRVGIPPSNKIKYACLPYTFRGKENADYDFPLEDFDIYSFGILLFHAIFHREEMYFLREFSFGLREGYTKFQQKYPLSEIDNLVNEYKIEIDSAILYLMKRCIYNKVYEKPNFDEVIQILKSQLLSN